MSVLYIASGSDTPSHLWMRRQVAALAPDIEMAIDPTIREPVRAGAAVIRPLTVGSDPLWRRGWRRVRGAARVPPPTASRELGRILASSRAATVIVQFLTTAIDFAAVLNACGKRVHVQCHGWDVTWDMRDPQGSGARMHPAEYAERVRALPPTVHFIVGSRESCGRLEALGIESTRIAVHYLGVPVPASFAREPGHSRLKLLYLGRLVDCKGPDLVIRAFEATVAEGVEAELVMAGDGPLRVTCELLRARSPVADRITILGAVDASTGERLRRDADIFVAHNCQGPVTQQVEAYGVSLVEAMAAGLPVITGRSGGVSEVVAHGETGLLIEPGDVRGQARAILELAGSTQERLRLGKNAWRRALESFSLEGDLRRLRSILGLEGTYRSGVDAGMAVDPRSVG